MPVLNSKKKAQTDLTRNQFALTQEIAPQQAQLRADINARYMPVYTGQYLNALDQADPTFRGVRDALGNRVQADLNAGYTLGDGLQREVEQGVRRAQTARGNYLGPAPEAVEAFARGSAAIDLNNQRQANARSFLQTRSAADMFSNFGIMEGYQPVNVITPSSGGIDPGLAFSAANADAGNRLQYQAQNNAMALNTYDRQWDRYLYGTAVLNGLYSRVSTRGGGGMGFNASGAATGLLTGAASGAMVGSVVPGIGTAVGAIGGAIIGGVGGGLATR